MDIFESLYFNATLEIFSIIILLIILLNCYFEKLWQNNRGYRFFIFLCGLAIISIGGDAISWLITGNKELKTVFTLMLAICMIGRVFFYLFYANCIFAWVEEKQKVHPAYYTILHLLITAILVCCVVSIFTGTFFTVNENIDYETGPYYFVLSILSMFVVLFFLVVGIRYNRSLGERDTSFVIIFSVLPVLASLQNYWDTLTPLISTIVILSLYIVICQKRARNAVEKEKELEHYKVAAMVSQIQPHFLFNTLTAIRHLCKNSPEARDAIADFSTYLRQNINSIKMKEPIPFEKELEHIETYLKFEKMRFGDKLSIKENIECIDFRVPALSIQPIVENAVKHGVGQKEEGGTVTISTSENGNFFKIVVEDDGVGFDENQEIGDGHIGISNMRQRLEFSCNAKISVKSKINKGTIVTIEIPKDYEKILIDREIEKAND